MTSQEKINHFRSQSESNYVFACHAAVPLVLTVDLLYALWHHFKTYHYADAPNQAYSIAPIAVSDFLLSRLCREVGFEVFELEKEVRTLLGSDLEMQLGATRKFNIATFLKAFASQPAPNPHFAYLKEIHLLTALSILSPQQLEKQIIQNINHAENDEAKIKQLLLHHALMNPKMPSALSKISGAVAESNDFDEIVPVLIETDDENDIGVFKLELPEFLQGKLRIVKRMSEKQMKELARSYLYEGERYQMQKDLDNAFLNFRKFLDITKPLCDNHPTGENMLLLAVGYLRLGEAYQSIEDWQAAITNFNFFLEIAKYLYNIKSTNENAKNLAISYLQLGYSRLGTTYKSLKDWNKALQFFQEFLMLTQQVHANKPSDESLKNLAFGYSKLGEIYQSQKDWDKALQFFQESLRITKLLDKQNDENLKN
ncbi:MAG: hypothetical protein RIS64_4571 [Bacteroidota bacterium]